MGKFTPDGYGYDVSEQRDCPYKEGLKCFLADCEDCPIHPDYESEEDIETFDSVYAEGWQQGFKKGYIQAMEEADEWVDEDEEDRNSFDLEGLKDTPYTLDKPIDWQSEKEPHTPYNEDIYEKLYQSGDLEPSVAKAYEMGKNYAYDLGLAQGLQEVEDYYILGYKDCFLGEEPMIFDEELKDLLETEDDDYSTYEDGYIQGYKDCLVELKPAVTNSDLDALIERCDLEKEEEEEKELYKAESEPLGFIVDGEIISGIESLKEDILDIKRKLNDDISMTPLVNKELYDLLHKLTVIQEKVSIDALHRHLGYK